MDKDEVIRRLKEHLKAREQENGSLNNRDKHFSIHYVEDFLEMTKKEAINFLKKHIPQVVNL